MKVSFWNRLASKFDQNDVLDPQLVETIKGHLQPNAHVLEIGAGTGTMALQLAPYCQILEASDFSAEMIAKAQAKETPDNLTFSVQNGAKLDDESRTFDVVVALNVLHIVENVDEVLVEIQRVLKPEGKLIIQVATFKEQQFVSIITRLAMKMLKFRLWTVEEYRAILTQHGLMVESCQEAQPGSLSMIIIGRNTKI